MRIFGERLRELRKKRGITQKQLATKFKISESAVGMYERGEREPPLELINRLADFFDVPTDWLLGRSDTLNPISNRENNKKLADLDENVYALARNLQDLDSESKEALWKIVEAMRKRGREAKND